MLQLVFSEDHPLNSTITDASTGQLVYKMKTPSRFIHRTTTINDAQGQFVAQYEQFWSNRKVTIRGCLFDFDTQFAPKTKKRSSRSTRRIIAGLDGQQYEWKCHDCSTWKLTDLQAGRVVANAKRAGFRRPMKLDVQPDVFPILDAIVLSLIVIESDMQAARAAIASSMAGGTCAGSC